MLNTISCATAFLIGFLGSLHCLGMCSGIAWILSANIEKKTKRSLYLYQIYYNAGRIFSYILIGLAASLLGFIISDLLNKNTTLFLQLFSGALLINIGLYISGKFQSLKHLELLGFKFWTLLSPYVKKNISIKSPFQALALGVFWGNVPCGLTYSVAIWTLSFNSVYKSCLLMIFFGLGTLPAMLITGVTVSFLLQLKQNKIVRLVSGYLIIALGLWTIVYVSVLK